MTELSDDILHAPDPSFNPKVFSEDEEEERTSLMETNYSSITTGGLSGAIPIAPMTPRRDEHRSRFLNSILNITDGNNFIRSPRFVYTNPSMLREQSELRKALMNSKNIKDVGGGTHESGEGKSVFPENKINNQKPSTSTTEPNNIAHLDVSVTASKFPPSTIVNETNKLNTYQNKSSDGEEIIDGSKEKNYLLEKDNTERNYTDLNLNDVINFCENFKIEDIESKKRLSVKGRSENTETSFLNKQGTSNVNKIQTNQSPVNIIASNVKNDREFPDQSSSLDITAQNIQKMKNALGKYLTEKEKSDVDNLKFIDDDTEILIDKMNRSCSMGYLDNVDVGLVPCELSLKLLQKDSPKRLILVGGSRKKNSSEKELDGKSGFKTCGKSKSLDSGEMLLTKKNNTCDEKLKDFNKKDENASVETATPKNEYKNNKLDVGDDEKIESFKENSTSSLLGNAIESLPVTSSRLPRSQPVTPAMSKKKRNQSSSPIR